MNNIQLKIRVDAFESSYTIEGTLVVKGTCSFKFYDNKETKVRPLQFVAYGQSAVTLQKAEFDSVHLISGRLNVNKPNPENPNHQSLLTVERTICIQQGEKTNNIVPLRKEYAPKTQTQAVPKNHQQVPVVDLELVPF